MGTCIQFARTVVVCEDLISKKGQVFEYENELSILNFAVKCQAWERRMNRCDAPTACSRREWNLQGNLNSQRR